MLSLFARACRVFARRPSGDECTTAQRTCINIHHSLLSVRRGFSSSQTRGILCMSAYSTYNTTGGTGRRSQQDHTGGSAPQNTGGSPQRETIPPSNSVDSTSRPNDLHRYNTKQSIILLALISFSIISFLTINTEQKYSIRDTSESQSCSSR
jgi:hypothetical protein